MVFLVYLTFELSNLGKKIDWIVGFMIQTQKVWDIPDQPLTSSLLPTRLWKVAAVKSHLFSLLYAAANTF